MPPVRTCGVPCSSEPAGAATTVAYHVRDTRTARVWTDDRPRMAHGRATIREATCDLVSASCGGSRTVAVATPSRRRLPQAIVVAPFSRPKQRQAQSLSTSDLVSTAPALACQIERRTGCRGEVGETGDTIGETHPLTVHKTTISVQPSACVDRFLNDMGFGPLARSVAKPRLAHATP